jgi:formylglycine-generating enzyme required for sulfatase activity
MSSASKNPIALALALIFCAASIQVDPLLAETAATPKAGGDLAFWEELAFWETIKDSKDPSEFEAYLAAYPDGRFARLAEIRIRSLNGQPPGDTEGATTPPEPTRNAESESDTADQPTDVVAPTSQGTFRDCDLCPLMVAVPAGTFLMGSDRHRPDEKPRHEVGFSKPFAIGVHEVTLAEWDACLREGGCTFSPEEDVGSQLPVGNVSWDDAWAYTTWLSNKTGQSYRLPTEAEWEYAAGAGTTTAFWWGDDIGTGNANCSDCGSRWDGKGPSPVGSFAPNPFGLYDVHGNLWEWTMDCVNRSYEGAPADGSAWLRGDCIARVLRGGSWNLESEYMRTTRRNHYDRDVRYYLHGFRVARSLP